MPEWARKVINIMKINWKLRLQSKAFWVALVSAIVLLTQQFGVKIFPENIMDIVNTILTIGVIVGVIVDPTTTGISDTERALEYKTQAPNVNDK